MLINRIFWCPIDIADQMPFNFGERNPGKRAPFEVSPIHVFRLIIRHLLDRHKWNLCKEEGEPVGINHRCLEFYLLEQGRRKKKSAGFLCCFPSRLLSGAFAILGAAAKPAPSSVFRPRRCVICKEQIHFGPGFKV